MTEETHPGVKVGHTIPATISKKGVHPNPLKCCICGESVAEKASAANKAIGWLEGNNPHPLGKEGDRACDPCNGLAVIPSRFLEILSR